MRLLDTATGEFRIVHDPRSVNYAIISHTWSSEGEQSYQDVLNIQRSAKSPKVRQQDPAGIPLDQNQDYAVVPHRFSSSNADDESISTADEVTLVPTFDSKEGPNEIASGRKLWTILPMLWNPFRSYILVGVPSFLSPQSCILRLHRIATYFTSRILACIPGQILYPLVARLGICRSPIISDTSSSSGGRSKAHAEDNPAPALVRPSVDEGAREARTVSDILAAAGHTFFVFNPEYSEKVRMSCVVARRAGFELVWLDSCCIDKASSAELSEAINSMYEWYECATVCFVYLADVDDDEDPASPDSTFRNSVWHYRGWTLQELIAPRHHVFLSRRWEIIGTKLGLARVIAQVTGISLAVLNHERSIDLVPVAQRMSWASMRRTTRIEDEAYSLMGIFGVHMPTIYGEGRNAFVRLQEEILRHTVDQSIFAWGPSWCRRTAPEVPKATCSRQGMMLLSAPFQHLAALLANSPADFKTSGDVRIIPLDILASRLKTDPTKMSFPEYMIGYGISTLLPIIPCSEELVHSLLPEPYHNPFFDSLAILACEGPDSTIICLPLLRTHRDVELHDTHFKPSYYVGAVMGDNPSIYYHTFALSEAQLDEHLSTLYIEDLRISRRPDDLRLDRLSLFRGASGHEHQDSIRCIALWCVRLEAWCERVLNKQGFLIRKHERKDIRSCEFLMFRAGDQDFEVIRISAVFIMVEDSSPKQFRGLDGFKVLYKTARPFDSNGDRLHDYVPELEEGECTEVSCDMNTTRTRWSTFRLRDRRGMSRTLRLSLTWSMMFAGVSIEISDAYQDDTDVAAATSSVGTSRTTLYVGSYYKMDKAERNYEKLLQYLLPMWMYFVVDKCSPEVEDVYLRTVHLHAVQPVLQEEVRTPEALFGGKYSGRRSSFSLSYPELRRYRIRDSDDYDEDEEDCKTQ